MMSPDLPKPHRTGRPSLGDAARIVRPLRLSPLTLRKLDDEAKRTQSNVGRIIDRLADPLP